MKYFTTCISNTRCWVGAGQTMRGLTPARYDRPRCRWGDFANRDGQFKCTAFSLFVMSSLFFYVMNAEFLSMNVWGAIQIESSVLCSGCWHEKKHQRALGGLQDAWLKSQRTKALLSRRIKSRHARLYMTGRQGGAEPPNCFILDRFYRFVWSEDLSTVSCFDPVWTGFKDEQFADSQEWLQATDITFMYK